MPEVLLEVGAEDHDVVHVREGKRLKGAEHSVNESLHNSGGVGETKGHRLYLIMTIHGDEGGELGVML
jgi:hypothetical protein